MVTRELLDPHSIVVVGASEDVYKPGGRTLENLLVHKYGGKLYAVNPKADTVQGVKSYHTVEELPQVECAILAIAAKYCPHAVEGEGDEGIHHPVGRIPRGEPGGGEAREGVCGYDKQCRRFIDRA